MPERCNADCSVGVRGRGMWGDKGGGGVEREGGRRIKKRWGVKYLIWGNLIWMDRRLSQDRIV